RMIETIKPDLVINSGVAGGAGVPIGTLLVADRVAYDDVWCGPSTEYGQADGCPLFFTPGKNVIDLVTTLFSKDSYRFGLICTGDKFISTSEEISFIRGHFPDVAAVDMESASIAQTCYLTSTPFNIIRVVSDTPGEGENLAQYENFWTEAPEKTFEALKTIISHI
ncbi:MAG: 5'-methylthioadenosine/S-adenosylhomocysteine nucleosidase, partial [Muribaculaceae bacterium]|nr:5'-methylthioadenosine/S-adenosylhomocysteine nucleosidase [Muribaculaceae bacterium]